MPARLIEWTDLEDGFCESIISGPPEYGGSISSIFLVIFGLLGLFMSRNHNILIRVASSALTVTGFGSIMYHWTLYAGWGFVDSIPMLISSWIGGYMSLDMIIYKKIVVERNNRKLYEKVSSAIGLVYIGLMCASICMSITEGISKYFSIMFLVAELSIAMSLIIIRVKTHIYMIGEVRAFRVMYIGFGSSVLGAIIWFTVENLCRKDGFKWMRYMQMHSFWHFSISFGMYYLMQFFIFVHAYDVGNNPYFVTSEKWKWFYRLIPVVEYRDKSKNMILLNDQTA